MDEKVKEAEELIAMIKATVRKLDDGITLAALVPLVCKQLNMPMLQTNPLFARTIDCLRN